MRIEPPMSLPVASGAYPAASAAADPPDDPPECELGVPRIAGDAPQLAVGEAGTAELRRGGADVDDPAGVLDAFDDRMVVLGDLVDQRQRTLLATSAPAIGCSSLAATHETLERSRGIALSEVSLLRRRGPRRGPRRSDDRRPRSARVVGLDLLDQALEMFHRRQVAAAEQFEGVVR